MSFYEQKTFAALKEDLSVVNVKGYAVKFKFDNVYSCCPGVCVSDTECDHIRALQADINDILNTSNENIGHTGNEIDRRTRCSRDLSRAIFEDRHKGTSLQTQAMSCMTTTKTNSNRCDWRQSITRIKDEIERKTKIPKALQHFSNQGKTQSERKAIQENNIMNEATLEMTLGLQGGMKEDEMTSAGSAEDRNMRRKHSEIGEIQLSDDTVHNKREICNASRRSEEKVESPVQTFRVNTMQNMEEVMKQTNETILQSVGLQPQG